jgi:integrase
LHYLHLPSFTAVFLEWHERQVLDPYDTFCVSQGSKYKSRKSKQVHQSNIYWIKYYRNGKAERENTHTSDFAAAKRLLQSREGDVARGIPVSAKLGRVKIDELTEDVITNYKINHKKSLGDVERRLRLHIIPFFGGRRAISITTSTIERFILTRQEQGAANATINRELAILKRAFSLGVRAGKILSKPYIAALKEANVRTGFFEEDQFKAVVGYLSLPLQRLMTFYFVTGCRKQEGLTLQWRQIDFRSTDTVLLDPGTTKNDEGRVFPFTKELRELLEAQRADTDRLQRQRRIVCPWVFHRDGQPIKSYDGAWHSACRNAGVPGRRVHDFRRSTVRRLEQAGVSRSVGMKLTGHKTESVYRRYAIVSKSDLEEATRRLDALSDKNGSMETDKQAKGGAQ